MVKRREFTAWGAVALLVGTSDSVRAGLFTDADAATGIKVALERGAVAAVGLLGQPDGFLGNAKVRIPLPGFLNDAAQVLKFTGQQKKVDALVEAMNRAAEAAVPHAQALLVQAVKTMSVDDAVAIVKGGNTSVTDFFAQRTRAPLAERFLPVVRTATEKVALAQKYNVVAGQVSKWGLVQKEDVSIDAYVTRKALDGLYLMIGDEERKIRKDPVGTGSDILKKVFG
jgi:TRAP-type mannitol/chloroaromatic compound transport system substrate-binding protein